LKLFELIDEFDDLIPEEKLELLIEFSDSLPELAPERAALVQSPQCLVQECQTPVYLFVALVDGRVHLEADVPRKSPTVRGLVALLVEGLEGAAPHDVVAKLPDDLLGPLGLQKTLGMTRQNGVRGLVARIKREVAAAAQEP
jgi:cysteine desulfuration protein SufE